MSHAVFSSYAQRQRDPRRHLLRLALVVGLHGALVWALLAGLGRQAVQVAQETVEAMLIAETPAPRAPTPPPMAPAPAPKPVVTPTAAPASPAPATAQSIAAPASAPSPAAVAAAPVRVGASMAPAGQCAKPAYPVASRRLEEEGTVSLRFLIGTDGHVLQAEVVKSSGFGRLDEAARLALSKCQFRPGTVDGKPEASWAHIQYQWRLE